MTTTITKPTVGGSNGTWGTELNTALDTIVNAVNTNTTDITARLSATTVSAKGDLIAGTGAGIVTRQAIGADKFVLTADSSFNTGMTWKLAPGAIVAKLRQTSAQSIASASFTLITFGVADYDRTGSFSAGTTFTPGVAGWYQLAGGYTLDNPSTAGSVRMAGWRISGTDLTGSYSNQAQNTAGVAEAVDARTIAVQLSTTDTVSLVAYHNRGAAVSTVVTAPYGSIATITYLGS